MKKVLSIVLAIAMIATMSAVAFADIEAATGTETKDVTATYVAGEQAPAYLIDIEWGSLAFTYTDADEVWDTENHVWKDAEGATGVWSVANEADKKITVTNHSSAAVPVAVTAGEEVEGLTVTVADGAATLGIGGAADSALTATVNVTGALKADHVAGAKIATITVKVGA